MKKLPAFLLILISVSHFGTTEVFAQKKAKPRPVIVIEISVPNFEQPDKREVLINRTAKSNYEYSGGGGQGCGGCGEERSRELAKSTYVFTARAWRMGRDKSKVGFEIEVGEQCQTQKIFKVYRHRQTKIRLNCGIGLAAYYGFETKETN